MIVGSAATSAAIIAAHAANQNNSGTGDPITDCLYVIMIIVIFIKLFFE